MERFTEFLIEKDEEEIKDLHIVIIGLGDEEGTFADLMQKVASKKKLKSSLVLVDEAYIGSEDIEKGSITIHNYDGKDNKLEIFSNNSIVFVRAGAISTLTSQALVSSLQSIGFFLVNDLQSMTLCDNKMAAAIQLTRNNIPVPRTAVINNVKSIEDAHKRIGGKFPVIIKTLRGTQGVGVSKVNDMASLVSVCQSLWKFDADILIQEFFKLSSDIRTLLINGKIIASAERIKQDADEFRNNVHLGADTKPYKLSEEEQTLVVNAARAAGAIYCGVDHCKVNDKYYILEINGSPGIRSHFMGYEDNKPTGKITDIEVLTNIIETLQKEEERRPLFRNEVGVIESVLLDGFDNNLIRAKFDTGNSAKATMLHVDKLEIDGDIAKWKKNGISFESDIIDISSARRGNEPFDKRPVIEHGITFNNKHYIIEIGLTEKDTASEMLINRKAMTMFRVAVNPNRKFVVSDYAPADDNTTFD